VIKEHGATESMIKQVLRNEFLGLKPLRYTLTEALHEDSCELSVALATSGAADGMVEFSGRGVGFVDALFAGLIEYYAREYPSLQTLAVQNFEVKGNMNTGNNRGTDAEVAVVLSVTNSEHERFVFENGARSLVAATCSVVFQMAEYFINSERAYITLYRALKDAKARNRQDLVDTYQAQLAEVVKSTSYSEVIARLE
jgi:hypothetical protein